MEARAKVSIWLDCDTGHDDAYAILLAAHHPRSRLLGVSTVHGNAPVHHTTANTLGILEAIGRPDIPVVRGEAKPLTREPSFAKEYHGESGLGGVTLLPETRPTQVNSVMLGVEHIYRCLMGEPEDSVWIVPTGPLTNIAKLILEYPDVLTRILGISTMGGAIGGGFSDAPSHRADGPGNWTRSAEFNIYCDPEAAHTIFSNPFLAEKITLSTLDLTHHCRATSQVLDLLSGASGLKRLMREILIFFAESYATLSGMVDGPPLHDPVAVFAVLEPNLFDNRNGERWKIDVVLVGDELGRTSITESGKCNESFRHRVPRGLDVESFWDAINACLNRAEKASTLD